MRTAFRLHSDEFTVKPAEALARSVGLTPVTPAGTLRICERRSHSRSPSSLRCKPFWAVALDHRGDGTRLIAVRESLQPGGKRRVPRIQCLHVVGPITDRAHI